MYMYICIKKFTFTCHIFNMYLYIHIHNIKEKELSVFVFHVSYGLVCIKELENFTANVYIICTNIAF